MKNLRNSPVMIFLQCNNSGMMESMIREFEQSLLHYSGKGLGGNAPTARHSIVQFPDGRSEETQDVLLLQMSRIQTMLQSLPEWPFIERLLQTERAIRNATFQKLLFDKEALGYLERLASFIKTADLQAINLDLESVLYQLEEMQPLNALGTCENVVHLFEKTQHLSNVSFVTKDVISLICPSNASSDPVEEINHIWSGKDNMNSGMSEETKHTVSIVEEFRGWMEIERQLNENSASLYKIYRALVSGRAPAEDLYFSRFQDSLLTTLLFNSFDEAWFALEQSDDWEVLTSFIRITCNIAHDVNQANNSQSSPFSE
ncbi:ATP-binding cassette sub-family A member 13-like [Ambystoma mexicanum]|uniref:ATP-binding cassette sub-family A member 13-like n=1 Tax=Ambystoma mexicanum TaxID=8296 RepID=UPI0037E71583